MINIAFSGYTFLSVDMLLQHLGMVGADICNMVLVSPLVQIGIVDDPQRGLNSKFVALFSESGIVEEAVQII